MEDKKICFKAVHLVVQNFETSVAHYERLGFKVFSNLTTDESISAYMYLSRDCSFCICLVEHLDERKVDQKVWIEIHANTNQNHSHAEVFIELQENGVVYENMPPHLRELAILSQGIIKDPDGNYTKIVSQAE